MALLQHGDKYQVVWNGFEFVIPWTDDTALANKTLFNIGVDPEAASGGSVLLPININGITKDNIGKINGVTFSNLGSINGVS